MLLKSPLYKRFGNALPFTWTVESLAKWVPVMATCNPAHAPSPVAPVIVTPLITGCPCDVTVKDAAELVDPPGPGLLTVSEPTVATCRFFALSTTVNVVALTKVVGWG